MVYLLAIVFVFDICIHYDFGWVGCKGEKVSPEELKCSPPLTSPELFPVLAVAGGIISADSQLAQLAHLLPTRSLLWNIHPHVSSRKPGKMILYIISRFKDIFRTAFNFLVILIIFLIGFGLGFHILFINHVSPNGE